MNFSKTTLWQEVHTGKKIYLPITPDMIDIEDISHALAHQCRYGGHVLSFYSVAEHSCHIADHVFRVSNDKKHALSALLHDASETYLIDVPKPVKMQLTNYVELEEQIEGVIAEVFDLNYPWSDLIKEADCRILMDERAALFHPSGHDWHLPVDGPLGISIKAYHPYSAKERFLERFHRYGD